MKHNSLLSALFDIAAPIKKHSWFPDKRAEEELKQQWWAAENADQEWIDSQTEDERWT